MSGPGHPLILYIPGLLPKPEPDIHRDALLRCILAGVRRIDGPVAKAIEADPEYGRAYGALAYVLAWGHRRGASLSLARSLPPSVSGFAFTATSTLTRPFSVGAPMASNSRPLAIPSQ